MDESLRELADADFVVVDHNTEELAIPPRGAAGAPDLRVPSGGPGVPGVAGV